MSGPIGLLNPMTFVLFCMGILLCCASSFHKRSNFSSVRAPRFTRFLYILLVLSGVRYGEALHPGPRSRVTSQAFCIGTFNPSGLAGKAQVINQYLQHGDIWSVAETHLSTKSVSSFRRGLRVTQSPYQYLVTGHPVPVRAHSHTSGGWKGVATLSRHPTRALPVSWDHDVSATSRVMVTATLLHDMWVTVGTLYGESAGTWHPHYLSHNDQLLRAVATQVCLYSTGLRVVAGDFNLKEHDVSAFQILEAAGFRDIQSIAADRWGLPIQNTCKCATRVDYMYVSPELLALLTHVEVIDTIWPDHSVLQAWFTGSVREIPRFVWKQPQAVDWPQFQVAPVQPFAPGTATRVYADMWHEIEDTASASSARPIPQACRGRAQTLAPKQVLGQAHAPLRAPRAGDLAPSYLGMSLQHAHWYRQARRLQSYVRFARTRRDQADPCHAANVWGAIRRAKGFEPDFAAWWCTTEFAVHGAPSECPATPPAADTAEAIYASFVLAFRALEKRLHTTCRATAKAKRLASPQLIFQDIRGVGVDSVDLLMQPAQSKICQVDEDTLCLHLDATCNWDTTKPVFVNGQSFNILHHEETWLWVDRLVPNLVGSVCTQVRLLGALEELFDEFRQSWSTRWQRHAHVPLSQWQDILEFARKYARPIACSSPSMTLQDLKLELKRKKAKTSRGLDGVTLTDLRAMPDGALSSMCQFYQHAEQCGEWPAQLTAGRVVSLAKSAQPRSAADFRPITVLSLGYRLWSSFHSRNIIAAIDDWLPPGLHGSRVGGHAGQVWHSVLLSIEESHDCGIPLAGVVGDIVKAFNCLSCPVIFELAGMLRLPIHVLTAWAGCTMQMARHFEVRNNLSPATMSVTGFAEGDGLSVLAMILLDCVLHWWMSELSPACLTLSYVDDWQLLMRNPQHVPLAMDRLEAFCSKVDLTLDKRKTYVWCLSPGGRKFLKASGYRVEHGGRSLGAHLQLTMQHTNQTLQARANSLHDMWDRLRLSPCPYKLKVRALTVAAWPRGLHGVASTGIGKNILHRLRSGAVRGLQADGAGCNPWIQLGLIEHLSCDPGFWAVVQTLRSVRDCAALDYLQPVLTRLAWGGTEMPANSITHTLLSRLQVLGWSVRSDGRLEDFLGPFCLFDASFHEIEYRAQLSWQAVVAQQVNHRSGLQNLHQADVHGTRRWLASLHREDAGICRKLLNGAHFTREAQQHWEETHDGVCQFCQCSDSRYHRFWQCEAFAHLRAGMDSHVWAMVPYLPEFLTCYGWGVRPANWTQYHQTLLAIEETPTDITTVQPTACDEWLDLFTDGSCHYPTQSWRLASWAVISAPVQPDDSGCKSQVLAASPLPGLQQTAFRAEIRAVLEAIRIAKQSHRRVRIWCDCQGVVSRVRALLQKQWKPPPNGRHSDLWHSIRAALEEVGRHRVLITKVAAHQDYDICTSALESWCFLHNGLVDHAARVAHMLRPHSFWDIHQKLVQNQIFAAHINAQVRTVQLAISRAVVYHQQATEDVGEGMEEPPSAPHNPCSMRPVWTAPPEVTWVSGELCSKYGERLVKQVTRWFLQGVRSATTSAEWTSFYQLYADYQLCTGEGGPLRLDRWVDPQTRPAASLLGLSFKLRCRWFTHLLKDVVKTWQIELHHQFVRPKSEFLLLHTSCAWLPWPIDRLDRCEQWFGSCLIQPARRDGRVLHRLPTPRRDPDMPEVATSYLEIR